MSFQLFMFKPVESLPMPWPSPQVRCGTRLSRLLPMVSVIWVGAVGAAGVNELPQVLVQGRAVVDEMPVAASEGQVLREQIESRPWLRPAEVLETVPGLVVTQHSGDGKANQYFLRGFNLDHGTDVAISALGMPVNQRSHAHGQGYSDLNFLIPELIDSLSYRKGPYLARDGDFATAGAVDIDYVSALARPSVSVGVGENGFKRLLAMGSWDRCGLGEALPGHVGGEGRLLLAFEAGANDGPWLVPEKLSKQNLVMRYSEGSAERGWRLTGMVYRAKWTATDQIPERAVQQGLVSEFGSLDPTSGGQTNLSALTWVANGRTGDDAARPWKASAYVASYGLDLYSDFTYALDPVHGDQFRQVDSRYKAGGEFAQTWRYVAFGVPHSLTGGAQLRHDHVGGLRLQLTQARAVYGTVRADKVDETSVGLFVDQASQWTPWLRSHVGARVDRFRFKVLSDTAANSGTAQAGIASPKLALTLTPSRELAFFANWGQGFHSNDARGTVISVDPDPRSETYGQKVERVTPLARATGAELGSSWSTPSLQLSAALWTLKLQSELVYSGDAGATEAGRPSLRRGLEFAAVWQPNAVWTADADATFTRARYDDGNKAADYIEGAVQRTFSAGLNYKPNPTWAASLRLRHIGPRQLSEDGRQMGAASTVLNAHAEYAFSRTWRLGVDVLNLADARAADMAYLYTSRLPGEAAPVSDLHFHPGEPRSVRLALKASFD